MSTTRRTARMVEGEDEGDATVEELLLGASALSAAGAVDRAVELLRRVLSEDRSELRAWAELSRLPGFTDDEVLLEAVIAVELEPDDDATRALRAHTLATTYDRLGRIDEAWRWYEEMNAALRVLRPYDASAEARFLDDVRTYLDDRYFGQRRDLVTTTARPIFVFGLPRSGTTLVEQILASHPDVRAGGELDTIFRAALDVYRAGSRRGSYARELPQLDRQRWTELAESVDSEYRRLAAGRDHVTDKMPPNDHHIGILAVMFPDASFVRVRRDPLDVCLSNYKLMYASRNPQANHVEWLADSWATHEALMVHWRESAPISILDVVYEELIADQVGQTQRLLAHCGLDWDDACLRFHEGPRIILTASRFQVRQPMYASSVGAWHRYSDHLAPMRRALARVGASDG